MDDRHRGTVRVEVHREHGARPQHHPWTVGLDERPGNPLQHLGVGHGGPVVTVAVLPQLPPPRLRQCGRNGRRPRLRGAARQPRPGVEAGLSVRPVTVGPAGRGLRVGHRAARPVRRAGAAPDGGGESRGQAGDASEDGPTGRQGLPPLSGAQWTALAPHIGGEPLGQRPAQCVGVRRDRLSGTSSTAPRSSLPQPWRTRRSRSGICDSCWEARTSMPAPSWHS